MTARLSRWPHGDLARDLGGGRNSLVIARPLHQHPRRRVAGLAAVVKAMQRAPFHRLFIRIGKDNIRALTAEFEGDALERIRRVLADRDARAGRACE